MTVRRNFLSIDLRRRQNSTDLFILSYIYFVRLFNVKSWRNDYFQIVSFFGKEKNCNTIHLKLRYPPQMQCNLTLLKTLLLTKV